MAQNYVLLERIELAAEAASVALANIPQSGYTDLKIVLSTRVNNGGANDAVNMALNTDAFNTNATIRLLRGTGSSVLSASGSYLISGYTNGGTSTANTFGNHEVYIPNYLSSNYKSISTDSVYEDNTTTAIQQLNALLWSNTAAINKITFAPNGGSNFVAGSTFSIYGLAAVGTTPTLAKAYGGNTVISDGTYWYHAFTSSGTFTPTETLSCDTLVVAGGGGGGGMYYALSGQIGGAGGGAGGLKSSLSASGGGGAQGSAISLSSGSYPVIVGAGGAGAVGSSSTVATQGSGSSISTITTVGGGIGGSSFVPGTSSISSGGNGGSGGGYAAANGGETTGTGTTNQGYDGGAGSTVSPVYGGGGGGGAGAIGGTGTSSAVGVGGIGVTSTTLDTVCAITGTGELSSGHYYFAGGGGGGAYGTPGGGTSNSGGVGGGGDGNYRAAGSTNNSASGYAGTASTGGGGGGSGGNSGAGYTYNSGGNGGSGIVIIRYAV